MPDNTEQIGGVSISITGDLSDLQASFSQAQTDAQTAGGSVAESFGTAGAAGMAEFNAMLAELDDKLAEIIPPITLMAGDVQDLGAAATSLGAAARAAGTDAEGAASGTTAFGDAAKEAGDAAAAAVPHVAALGGAAEEAGAAASGAEGGLSGMAEQMVALGEALVIAEGLKTFGEGALEASDNITHANIALTTLTHDGDGAKATIAGLEQIGVADGLSMPSLLTAATRMTAILAPGTDVDALLRQIADGAAVMGTDIATAATKFDMMATSGMASARTMTAIGLSLGGLAIALNTVSGNTDATAANAAKMFKALDQSERVEVLSTALSKMGGTAEKVANQTFSGQWASLAAQWDQTMVEAGQALMPVTSGLLELLKVDVLPFLKGLADDFAALPAPIQEAAVVLGVIGAAVTVAGLAVKTLGMAIAPLAGLYDALTASSLTAAAAEETEATAAYTAATAHVALGTSSAAAGGEMAATGLAVEGVGGLLSGVLALGLAAAVFGLIDLKANLDAAHASLKNFSDEVINASLTSFLKELQEGSVDADQLKDAQKRVTEAMGEGIGNAQLEADVLRSITQQMNLLAGADSGYVSQLTINTATTKLATDAVSVHNAVLADAQYKLALLTAEYANHQASAEQLLTAQDNVAAAQLKVNKAINEARGAVDGVVTATHDYIPIIQGVATEQEIAAAAAEAQNAHVLSLSMTLDGQNQKLYTAEQNFAHVANAMRDGLTTYAAYKQAADELSKAESEAEKAQAAFVKGTEAPAMTTAFDGSKTAIVGMVEALGTMLPATEAIIKPAQTLAEAFKVLKLTVDDVSGDVEQKMVAAFDTVAASNKTTLQQVEAAWGQASGAISKVAKTDLPETIKQQGLYVDALERTNAPLNQILAAEAARLKNQIALAQQQQTSADQYIIELANVNERTLMLNATTNILGRTYQAVLADVNKDFGLVASNISKLIVEGGKFSAVWHTIWTSFAEDILTTAITAIEQWVLKLILGNSLAKASSSALDVGQVVGSAGVAGAAGFASVMETIPFPANVALAPVVAAAAAGSVIASFVPLAAFEQGIDYVPQDMLALIHQGEKITPASQNTSTTNNGAPVSVTINVIADRRPSETARQLVRHLKTLSPVFSPMGAG
jgi:hypothetical protein